MPNKCPDKLTPSPPMLESTRKSKGCHTSVIPPFSSVPDKRPKAIRPKIHPDAPILHLIWGHTFLEIIVNNPEIPTIDVVTNEKSTDPIFGSIVDT